MWWWLRSNFRQMIGKRLQRSTKQSGKMEKLPPPRHVFFYLSKKGIFGVHKRVFSDNTHFPKSFSPPVSSALPGVRSLPSFLFMTVCPLRDQGSTVFLFVDSANNQEEPLGETRVSGSIGLHMSHNNLVTQCTACQALQRHVNNYVSTA